MNFCLFLTSKCQHFNRVKKMVNIVNIIPADYIETGDFFGSLLVVLYTHIENRSDISTLYVIHAEN